MFNKTFIIIRVSLCGLFWLHLFISRDPWVGNMVLLGREHAEVMLHRTQPGLDAVLGQIREKSCENIDTN